MRRAGLALALGALVACGGRASAPPPVTVPSRAATAGDALLPYVPVGAAVLIELDLARLRANPTVGALARGLIDGDGAAARGAVAPAALVGADAAVLATYAPGQPDARTITVVRGGQRPQAAVALAADVWALADEGATADLLAAARAGGVTADRALMAMRAAVMPAGADGAAIRLTARLDGPARRELGALFDEPRPPAAVAAWLDVADDLAAVVWVDAAAAATVEGWRDRLAAALPVRAIGVAPAIAAGRVEARGAGAVATIVIGPGRLARAVARWQARLTP
ncbi:MAG: hypothetical protein IPH44_16240 [Myxococcales bacterium]|nr:hypothetical protein [Myxococcales bacterium]